MDIYINEVETSDLIKLNYNDGQGNTIDKEYLFNEIQEEDKTSLLDFINQFNYQKVTVPSITEFLEVHIEISNTVIQPTDFDITNMSANDTLLLLNAGNTLTDLLSDY